MTRSALMGGHTHSTMMGIEVHIWQRDGKYLARGRFQGKAFGETLGTNEVDAAARFRQILTDIDNGTFVRANDRRKRLVSTAKNLRLTLRDLVAEFLTQKRAIRGIQTARDYSSRLTPILDFAEQSDNLKRWPLAIDIDVDFVRSLRAFLYQYKSARNGRPSGNLRSLSTRQIVNIMECLRTMLHWARSAPVRKLPADWVMPVTSELIGQPPAKNPLRDNKLPLDVRVAIVRKMDTWQLCQLSLSMIVPLRPDEAAGLVISDVNFEKGWLEFGERFKDVNFTKGKVAFVLPYPPEADAVLRACIGTKSEGPLLRSRRVFDGGKKVERVPSPQYLLQLFETELLNQPAGAIQAGQDRKLLFRHLLRRLGGVTEDAMNKEFKKLLSATGVSNGATLYSLRSSVTTEMHRANLPHLEMRYLTGHATNDILNEYTSLDPVGAMNKYFGTIQPLLSAISERATDLGLTADKKGESCGSTS